MTMPSVSWGAAPGSSAADIQSGAGFVRNSLCVENIDKSVVWSPWGSSKMGNSASLELLCKGLNNFYRRAAGPPQMPRWLRAPATAARVHGCLDCGCRWILALSAAGPQGSEGRRTPQVVQYRAHNIRPDFGLLPVRRRAQTMLR